MQFTRQVLQPGFGVHYGSNVLQCLMDDASPGVDLLVREAVQNSLDAAADGASYVSVEFEYSKIELSSLRGILDEETVGSLIEKRAYLDGGLYIRDKGTVGLSGPKRFIDGNHGNYGNFLKLCFSVGLKQEKEGSGGSWGFGKSIFFRVCAGPVLYYSRFIQNGFFFERLIFCLIENQTIRHDCILSEGAGLAWWGDYDEATASVVPCEDPNRIRAVLDKLGLPRYSQEETGTLIFLPCLRSGQIPVVPEPLFNKEEESKESLESNLEAFKRYTSIAIQRWYSPRLEGGGYTRGACLKASVNGVEVGSTGDPLLPFFDLIRKLYSCAVNGEVADPDLVGLAKLIPLQLRSTFADGDTSPGILAAIRLPHGHSLIRGRDSKFPDPEVQVFNFKDLEQTRCRPIIAMARQPGMVVAYRNSGEWVDEVMPDPDGCLLVGVFVLRSAALLMPDYLDACLEEYVRHREPPAHNDWLDGQSPGGKPLTIIRRLKAAVAKGLNRTFYLTNARDTERSSSRLGDVLGSLYLPNGFGQSPKVKAKRSGEWHCPEHQEYTCRSPGLCPNCDAGLVQDDFPNKGASESPRLTVVKQRFPREGMLYLEIEVFSGSSEHAVMDVMIASEGAAISRRNWDDWVGTQFPVTLSEINLISYRVQEDKWASQIDHESLSAAHDMTKYGDTSIPASVLLFNNHAAVEFKFNIKNVLFKFSLLLSSWDTVGKPVLFLRPHLADQR